MYNESTTEAIIKATAQFAEKMAWNKLFCMQQTFSSFNDTSERFRN